MHTTLEVIELDYLGMVRLRGADAVKFLQGQLSNDVARLDAEHSLLAGYHNPQGRTIALLRLVQWGADDVLAVLPRELSAVVATRLAKFVLRAKVKVVDESVGWRVAGLVGGADAADAKLPVAGLAGGADAAGGKPPDLPTSVGAQVRVGDAVFVCVGDQPKRWLAITPADAPSLVLNYPASDFATWQRLEVAAGQPQVYAATSEEFVAQMLNLDALNAIAFDKGCYTGQEVIARAHYRGRVKRRMQRFVSRDVCQLSPGDSGQLADGRTFKVVVAAQLEDGRCDFLAVAPIAGAGIEPIGSTQVTSAALAAPAATTAGVTTQAIHPEAPPMTDPTAPPVAGPMIDPTLAPVAAATVAPTVAAAAALSAAAPTPSATNVASGPASAASAATPPVASLLADAAPMAYPLPE
jgi:folate-binding protein YgfZ